jgi:glycosyltransferase involved in cell wall biosynthesis
MACGLPVVVTNSPGCRDIVTHGKTGLLSPVKDEAAMAANIEQVLSHEVLRQQLVQQGLTHAKGYDWAKVAEKYVACYKRAIEN